MTYGALITVKPTAAVNRGYLTDDDLDREALARRNREILLVNGVEPALVERWIPERVTKPQPPRPRSGKCAVCGAPAFKNHVTCGARACTYARNVLAGRKAREMLRDRRFTRPAPERVSTERCGVLTSRGNPCTRHARRCPYHG